MKDLIEKMKRFSELKDDWDNEGALIIEKSAITRAIRFIHALNRKDVLKDDEAKWYGPPEEHPQISYGGQLNIIPIAEGGIQFMWDGGFIIIKHFIVTIPPEGNQKICYEYEEEHGSEPPICLEKGYSFNSEKIIDKLKSLMGV